MKSRAFLMGVFGWFIIIGLLSVSCATKPDIVPEQNLEKKSLSEFVHILEKYRNGVLANRNGERLRTQIITFSFAEENRVFFCTTSDKPMYTQLTKFPEISFCTFPEDFEPVLSLNGKVIFVEDRALKQKALETNYYAMRNFKTVDNPLLRVFYIDVEIIETYSREGAKIFAAR